MAPIYKGTGAVDRSSATTPQAYTSPGDSFKCHAPARGDVSVRNRHPLSDKDAGSAIAFLEDAFGMEPLPTPLEKGTSDEGDVLIADGRIVAWRRGDRFWPTVHGLLMRPPARAWVTVDMGAVPHVTNGADVMAPGIVDADEAIREGDPVWIRDVDNEQPLAVGRALVDGPPMVDKTQDKVVETLHHVGDDLFELSP